MYHVCMDLKIKNYRWGNYVVKTKCCSYIVITAWEDWWYATQKKGNKSRSTYTIETERGRISKSGESSIDRDGRNAAWKGGDGD